jgi:hypothetical protein
MNHFDLLGKGMQMDGVEAARLGFRKVFSMCKDIGMLGAMPACATPSGRSIMCGGPAQVMKQIRDARVVGAIIAGSVIDRRLLQEMHSEGKTLIFAVGDVTLMQRGARFRELSRMRSLLMNATHYRVECAMVSLASAGEAVLSSAQLIEVAKAIGAGDTQAGMMLGRMGAIV